MSCRDKLRDLHAAAQLSSLWLAVPLWGFTINYHGIIGTCCISPACLGSAGAGVEGPVGLGTAPVWWVGPHGADGAGRQHSQLLHSAGRQASLNALASIISNYTRCIRSQTALNLKENLCHFQVQSSKPPQPHEKLIFLELLKKCLLMI